MEADRVWAILGSGAEYAAKGGMGIVSGVNAQRLTLGAVKPGEHDHLVPDTQIRQAFLDFGREFEPSLRRAFVPLLRRLLTRLER